VLHREPTRAEFAKLLERRLHYLYQTVAQSKDYRVLDGATHLLVQLLDDGYLLGIVTGNLEAAAHIKLHRARLNRFFSFGGYGSDSTDRGELTRTAVSRATLVYGEKVSPAQCLTLGDTPHAARVPTPRGSPVWAWPAVSSAPASSKRAVPTLSSPHSKKAFLSRGRPAVRNADGRRR